MMLGLSLLGLAVISPPVFQEEIKVPLAFKSKSDLWAQQMFYVYSPMSLKKPAEVKKEPVYKNKPIYGKFKVGPGDDSIYAVAVDENPQTLESVVYLDANRNGDFTDDGPTRWDSSTPLAGEDERNEYMKEYVLDVSYNGVKKPTSLMLGKFSNDLSLHVYSLAVREGTFTRGGKTFTMAVTTAAEPLSMGGSEPLKNQPARLMVDLDANRQYLVGPVREIINLNDVFTFEGKNYEAVLSADNSSLTLKPTKRPLPETAAQPDPLSLGITVPDAPFEDANGKTVKLSDFRGKVVILDFWATWCGPCKASLKHLASVAPKITGQGAVILAVCTSDKKEVFQKWIKEKAYPVTFAFNGLPDGEKIYHVSAIPATYIIDKEGKIVAAYTGGMDGADPRLNEGLAKVGVKL